MDFCGHNNPNSQFPLFLSLPFSACLWIAYTEHSDMSAVMFIKYIPVVKHSSMRVACIY